MPGSSRGVTKSAIYAFASSSRSHEDRGCEPGSIAQRENRAALLNARGTGLAFPAAGGRGPGQGKDGTCESRRSDGLATRSMGDPRSPARYPGRDAPARALPSPRARRCDRAGSRGGWVSDRPLPHAPAAQHARLLPRALGAVPLRPDGRSLRAASGRDPSRAQRAGSSVLDPVSPQTRGASRRVRPGTTVGASPAGSDPRRSQREHTQSDAAAGRRGARSGIREPDARRADRDAAGDRAESPLRPDRRRPGDRRPRAVAVAGDRRASPGSVQRTVAGRAGWALQALGATAHARLPCQPRLFHRRLRGVEPDRSCQAAAGDASEHQGPSPTHSGSARRPSSLSHSAAPPASHPESSGSSSRERDAKVRPRVRIAIRRPVHPRRRLGQREGDGHLDAHQHPVHEPRSRRGDGYRNRCHDLDDGRLG